MLEFGLTSDNNLPLHTATSGPSVKPNKLESIVISIESEKVHPKLSVTVSL